MDFKSYIKDKCDVDVQIFTKLKKDDFVVTILTTDGITYSRSLPANQTDAFNLAQTANELVEFIFLLRQYQTGLQEIRRGTLQVEKTERHFPHVVTAYRNRINGS